MKNSFLIIFSFLLINCSENYTPKPRAFFKLDFPQKEYHKIKQWISGLMNIPFGHYSKLPCSIKDKPEKITQYLMH